jgi:integrase/recombinase XerD
VLASTEREPKSNFVSVNSDGQPWTEYSLGKAFERATRRAGLTGWSLHSLRHYFVTSLFRAGVSAPTVQSLAGHGDLKTTQRYSHVAAVDLRNAIEKLSRASGC